MVRGSAVAASLMITLLLPALPSEAATRGPALTGTMEFCAHNSPDGVVTVRTTTSTATDDNILYVLDNGECGLMIKPAPKRIGGMVQVIYEGRNGWVKSKWIVKRTVSARVSTTSKPKVGQSTADLNGTWSTNIIGDAELTCNRGYYRQGYGASATCQALPAADRHGRWSTNIIGDAELTCNRGYYRQGYGASATCLPLP